MSRRTQTWTAAVSGVMVMLAAVPVWIDGWVLLSGVIFLIGIAIFVWGLQVQTLPILKTRLHSTNDRVYLDVINRGSLCQLWATMETAGSAPYDVASSEGAIDDFMLPKGKTVQILVAERKKLPSTGDALWWFVAFTNGDGEVSHVFHGDPPIDVLISIWTKPETAKGIIEKKIRLFADKIVDLS